MIKTPVHINLHHAIQHHLLIELNYDNEGVRVVEPYCLGRSNSGNIILRAFQSSGHSGSITPGWKLFDLGKMTEIKVLTDTFDPTQREEYQIGDKLMKTIFIQIY